MLACGVCSANQQKDKTKLKTKRENRDVGKFSCGVNDPTKQQGVEFWTKLKWELVPSRRKKKGEGKRRRLTRLKWELGLCFEGGNPRERIPTSYGEGGEKKGKMGSGLNAKNRKRKSNVNRFTLQRKRA